MRRGVQGPSDDSLGPVQEQRLESVLDYRDASLLMPAHLQKGNQVHM